MRSSTFEMGVRLRDNDNANADPKRSISCEAVNLHISDVTMWRREREISCFGVVAVTCERFFGFLLYFHLFLVSQQLEGANNHY